jgi:hypothetical protein
MDYEMDHEADNERQRPGGKRELFGEVIVRGARRRLYMSQHVISTSVLHRVLYSTLCPLFNSSCSVSASATSPTTNTLMPTEPDYPHPHPLTLTSPPPPLVHPPKLPQCPVSQHQGFVDSFASQGSTPAPVASSINLPLLTPTPSASTSASSSLALPST